MATQNQVNGVAGAQAGYARTGKDGGFYSRDGKLIATVDTFTSNITFNNASYSVLGNALELEAPNTFKVNLTMSQVVVESDIFIEELFQFMTTGVMPVWNFSGKIHGKNGDTETIVYNNCVPSGQVDLHNITTGEVVKRSWNFVVNEIPKLEAKLPKMNQF